MLRNTWGKLSNYKVRTTYYSNSYYVTLVYYCTGVLNWPHFHTYVHLIPCPKYREFTHSLLAVQRLQIYTWYIQYNKYFIKIVIHTRKHFLSRLLLSPSSFPRYLHHLNCWSLRIVCIVVADTKVIIHRISLHRKSEAHSLSPEPWAQVVLKRATKYKWQG